MIRSWSALRLIQAKADPAASAVAVGHAVANLLDEAKHLVVGMPLTITVLPVERTFDEVTLEVRIAGSYDDGRHA